MKYQLKKKFRRLFLYCHTQKCVKYFTLEFTINMKDNFENCLLGKIFERAFVVDIIQEMYMLLNDLQVLGDSLYN